MKQQRIKASSGRAVTRTHQTPHYFPQKTVLSIALIAAFAANTPLAMAYTGTISGGVAGTDYTVDATSLTVTGTINSAEQDSGSTLTTVLNKGGTIATVGVALLNNGSIGTFTNINSGVVTGNIAIQNVGTIENLTNTETGTIIGYGSGTIGYSGVDNLGTLGTFSNAGYIATNASDSVLSDDVLIAGVLNQAQGSIAQLNNLASGLIEGGYTGIGNYGSIGTLVNDGTVSGAAAGVGNFGTIDQFTNSGSVSGTIGIGNIGLISTLENSGTIKGAQDGVFNGTDSANDDTTISGTIETIGNRGLIEGKEAILNDGGLIGTLVSVGTIQGDDYGIHNVSELANGTIHTGSIGELVNGGEISGSLSGIYNQGAAISSVENVGTIQGYSNGILNDVGTVNGTVSGGTIGAIMNGGTIQAFLNGIANNAGSIGTIVNAGTIAAGNASSAIQTSTAGIYNSGAIGSVVNNVNGVIAGVGTGTIGYNAIFNDNGGVIGTIVNAGSMSGVSTAVGNNGTIGSLTNSGTITETTSASCLGTDCAAGAVANSKDAVINSLVNTGLITGTPAAINNDGTIGLLTNSGTLSSPGYAIANDDDGSIGLITNTGVIAGNILNESTKGLTINGGLGSTIGTLTGYDGSVGSITSTSSDLTFAFGNIVLNDDINVGTHTVYNNVAALEVDRPTTITGNYSQGEAAALLIGVNSGALTTGDIATDAGYGRLVVSGDVTIASESAIQLKQTGGDYKFAAGQRYVVVDAAGTAVYNEKSLAYSILGYESTLTGDAVTTADGHTDLVITVDNASAGGSGGGTVTPATPTTAVANAAINGLMDYTGADVPLNNTRNALIALAASYSDDQDAGTAALNRAGAQLAPISSAATARAAAAPTFEAVNVIGSHLDGLRLAQSNGTSGVSTGEAFLSATSPARSTGVWGQVFGGHASQNARDGVDGYSANFGGLLFGVDRALNDAWRVGGAFSYSNIAINNTLYTAGDTTRVNAYGLTGYGGYTAERWYANLSASAILQRYNATRKIDFTGFSGTAGSSFGGAQYVMRGEVGMPLAVGPVTITPLAALTYSYQHQGSYTENGGNGAALSVGSSHLTSVKSDLGARFQRAFTTRYGELVPQITVAWRHEYDNSRTATAATYAADASGETSFTTLGSSPVSNLADVNVGVTLLRANNLSISARYEVQAGKGYVSQGGSLKLRQLF